jgi:cytochrome b561
MNVTHSLIAILALIVFWRITHPVAPASSLPAWQQLISEAAHWLLYAPVLAITMTGWIFASERGWSISLFFAAPLPYCRQKARCPLVRSGSGMVQWNGRCS